MISYATLLIFEDCLGEGIGEGHIPSPRPEFYNRILIYAEPSTFRIQGHEIAVFVRSKMDEVRIQKVAVIGRCIATIAAVEYAIRIHVLQRGKPSRGHLVRGDSLDRLKTFQVEAKVVVIHYKQVGPVGTPYHLQPHTIHIALNQGCRGRRTAIGGRIEAHIAPPRVGGSVDTAYGAAGGGVRNEELQPADLLTGVCCQSVT
jgi:hypothetical protein